MRTQSTGTREQPHAAWRSLIRQRHKSAGRQQKAREIARAATKAYVEASEHAAWQDSSPVGYELKPWPFPSQPTYQSWMKLLDRAETVDGGINPNLRHAQESEYEPESIQVHGFTICGESHELARRIDQSRRILELEDDWDDEGSPGYEEATWRAAVAIIAATANAYWQSKRRPIPIPTISEGPDGSIDVIWRSGTRQVLINVPPEENGPVTFSGLDKADEIRTVKGRLGTDPTQEWLISWLTA
jgi:hypothetical protein